MQTESFSVIALLYAAVPVIIIVLIGLIVALLFRMSARLNQCVALLEDIGNDISLLQSDNDESQLLEPETFDAD